MNNQTTNPVFHGSDIEKISACYHIKKEAIVNFAGNVNPLGLPASVKEAVATHILTASICLCVMFFLIIVMFLPIIFFREMDPVN